MAIISIDFDRTCVTHEFPKVGRDIGAISALKDLVDKGHKLILFTMRSNDSFYCKEDGLHKYEDVVTYSDSSGCYRQSVLFDAIDWFTKNDIELWGVNQNPEQKSWTSSPKPYAHVYIDDAALGVPLIDNDSDRPYVDWIKVREILIEKGYL